jgi:hypothetical protein
VFVDYGEGEVSYEWVMRYLMTTYSAPEPQPQHNPNSGHMLFPLVHVLGRESLEYCLDNEDDDDDY